VPYGQISKGTFERKEKNIWSMLESFLVKWDI
jgi:hypothetical protein